MQLYERKLSHFFCKPLLYKDHNTPALGTRISCIGLISLKFVRCETSRGILPIHEIILVSGAVTFPRQPNDERTRFSDAGPRRTSPQPPGPASENPRGTNARAGSRAPELLASLLRVTPETLGEWFSEGMAPPASCLALAVLFDSRRQYRPNGVSTPGLPACHRMNSVSKMATCSTSSAASSR